MFYFEKVLSHISNHAGSKAVLDAENILKMNGWLPLKQNNHNRLFRVFSLFLATIKLRNTVLLFQYPSDIKKIKIIKYLRKNNVKSICLIHDIESLRYLSEDKGIEIKNLNQFDKLIVHNNNMKQWLEENGCTAKMVTLELFDYLIKSDKYLNNDRTTDIIFSGNLSANKSGFVYKLNEIQNISVNLYGPSFNGIITNPIKYKGQYNPEELVYNIEGKYGLIWDGASLESCEGVSGNYTKYNNPHKLSFYIASELPVICWSQMAIANFVKEHNIGICVDNLNHLHSSLTNISTKQYGDFLQNVKQLKNKVIKGEFLLSALKKFDY